MFVKYVFHDKPVLNQAFLEVCCPVTYYKWAYGEDLNF